MDRMEALQQVREEYHNHEMSAQGVEQLNLALRRAQNNKQKNRWKKGALRPVLALMAATLLFVLLPNMDARVAYAMEQIRGIGELVQVVVFRNYTYESDRNNADVTVPELVMAEENQQQLEMTAQEINQEIETLTDQYVAEFTKTLSYEEGYQDLYINHEVIASTQQFFTLKLIVYQGAGSGYEQHFFYTIDLNSGERMQLKDLFLDNTDYLSAISEDIQAQMRQQKAQEDIPYWIDDPTVEEWNFETIKEDQTFYVNEDNELVICFNEGDVAPMYVGCVEFVINQDAIASIRR